MKNYIFYLALIILLISFTSADYLPHQQLVNYTLVFNADNSTSCNFTYIQYSDNSISNYFNTQITKNNQVYTYYLNQFNFTKLGNTCMFYTCLNPSATPNTASGSTCINITPDGTIITTTQIYIYILFLIICLIILYLSFRLIINNPYSKDTIKPSEKYKLKQESRVLFYLELLKHKLWIVGLFGLYLSFFLFTAILNNLVFNLGLSELNLILIYLNDILAWGLIPFVLFWFVYIILYFFSETSKILKYQFMGGTHER